MSVEWVHYKEEDEYTDQYMSFVWVHCRKEDEYNDQYMRVEWVHLREEDPCPRLLYSLASQWLPGH